MKNKLKITEGCDLTEIMQITQYLSKTDQAARGKLNKEDELKRRHRKLANKK